MKPRPVDNGYLTKALEIEQRLEALEISKAKCDCKEGECDCKDCPKCGSKMNKMGCMKMGCGGKMAKAEPGFTAEKISNVNPSFHAESGGQTKSGYFTTNGKTIESEDAKPKRAKDNKKVDMGKLGGRMNPHAGTGVEREDSAGEGKPLKKGIKSEMRESGAPVICKCGATPLTGCKGPFPGVDIFACEAFEPLR